MKQTYRLLIYWVSEGMSFLVECIYSDSIDELKSLAAERLSNNGQYKCVVLSYELMDAILL